jgi:hypothetical protein
MRLGVVGGKEGGKNRVDMARENDVRTQSFSFEVHACKFKNF